MYLFNPDNDLALANFNANYTPPASARKITEDLSVLPFWYAPAGSKIVIEDAASKVFLESMQSLFGTKTSAIPFSKISDFPNEKIIPWGWNPALRKRLLEANVPENNLPTSKTLQRLRDYSGRQYAVKMLRELKHENEIFCGESHYFTSVDDVLRFLASQSGNSVLKMPNSGSGKGLVWILGEITGKQTDWAQRAITTQGGIVAEPVLNKIRDFAMEFYMDSGDIRFVGYSLFHSAASGAYMGNVLMSDEKIEKQLSEYVSTQVLHQLCASLQERLLQFFPFYSGYLGVDMMVCQTPAGYQIQPCVEINMRMNMGLVAHTFYERFVAQETSGRYMVDFFKKTGEALAFHQKMQTDFPLIIKNGRIEKGYLALAPVNELSSYMAWVLIERLRPRYRLIISCGFFERSIYIGLRPNNTVLCYLDFFTQ
jgi:hypothetical protein